VLLHHALTAIQIVTHAANHRVSADGQDTRAQQQNISAIDMFVAVTGDDGLVYLIRPTSPVTVYAISATGEVVHKIVVGAPGGKGSPIFGIRVAKNKLVVRFAHACDSTNDSCQLLACRAIND
jgi:hypothetical protein